MAIRTQLISLMLIPLLCAAGAVSGLLYAQRLASLTTQAIAQTNPLSNELQDFIRFLQEPPAGSGKPAQYHLQAARNRISSLSVSLRPVFSSADEKELLARVAATPIRLSTVLEQATRGSSVLSSRGAALLSQEINSALPAIEQLNSFYAQTLQARSSQISTLYLSLALLAAAWPLLLSVLLYRSWAVPLARLKEAIAAVTRGDLACRLAVQSDGEAGQLAASFNKMVEARQKSEVTARENEARLKDNFELLPLPVVSLDQDGVITYCNEQLINTSGYKRHELVGRNWFDLLLPNAEQIRQRFSEMLRTGETVRQYQGELLTKAGVTRIVLWHNTLCRDGNGKLIGVTSIGYDSTEQRASEQALERDYHLLRSLVDATPESLCLLDRSGMLLVANTAFAQQLNKKAEQLLRHTLTELFSPAVAQQRLTMLEQAAANGTPLTFQDSHDLWQYEHHLVPIRQADGTVEQVALLSLDITQRQRTETEQQKGLQLLTQQAAEAEQQVAGLTAKLEELQQELAQAHDTAAEASRSKSEFLANMSHEIRTPMNAILGLVHLALRTELTHKQREYLDTVSIAAQSLLEIINDIIDVSRIEAGRLQLACINFSLGDVVHRALALQAIKAKDKGIQLEYLIADGTPDTLRGDPLRLEQVLANLLNNAVKFTEQGSVTLQILQKPSLDNDERLALEFSVTDTGIGLDEQTISRLFQPFSQGDTSTTRTHGGSGLGLTICKHLVEMMEGSIEVESKPGVGSCFRLHLLFGKGTAAPLKIPSIDRALQVQRYQSLQGLRVLLVEDHPVNSGIAREILEAVGIQVEVVDNGRKAVSFMEEQGDSIDLILMDIQMPIMDGHEATSLIRRRYSRNRLPIIAMTAHAMKEERKRCLASGMNEHLPKPIVVEKLYELLARLTKRPPAPLQPDAALLRATEQLSDQLPEQLPGIAVETALGRVNGNGRLLAQLITLFAQDHQAMPAEIRHLLQERDLDSAARLVHGLKGVAGNLSAERLHIAATNLENALRNQDADGSEALLPLFEAALQEICATATLLAAPPIPQPADTGPASSEELAALIGELQHLFELHSLEVTKPLERLQQLLSTEDDLPLLTALVTAAQRLDYQQALVLLHTLSEKTGNNKERHRDTGT